MATVRGREKQDGEDAMQRDRFPECRMWRFKSPLLGGKRLHAPQSSHVVDPNARLRVIPHDHIEDYDTGNPEIF